MKKYMMTLVFNADNMDEAEDKVAALLPNTQMWARSSLYYEDPIKGGWALWAEPAMTAEELEMRRDR